MKTIKRFIAISLIMPFVMTTFMPAALASQMPWMPQPGAMVGLSAGFTPAQLWGMSMHPNDPFKFDFLVKRGDIVLSKDQKQEEYSKLIKYFLAALAIPDTDQWVNLSPYEQDRIIPDNFGLTEMGRDLLAQDYLLKQLSSSLTDPNSDLGKRFWDGVYAEAFKRFGSTQVPTDMFNKVWIMPDKAVVFEKNNTVYVLESHLKVMTEKDYLALRNNVAEEDVSDAKVLANISSQIIKEVIVPAIEKEVNEGKGFAPLRQVYSGMLLATWYKRSLKESILGKLYADQGKVKGVDQDPAANQEIYKQYVQAFQKGVFNMIKEDVDKYTQEVIPRKYFSGGTLNAFDKAMQNETDASKAEPVVADWMPEADVVTTDLVKTSTAVDQNWSSKNIGGNNVFPATTIKGMGYGSGVLMRVWRSLTFYVRQVPDYYSNLIKSSDLDFSKRVESWRMKFPDISTFKIFARGSSSIDVETGSIRYLADKTGDNETDVLSLSKGLEALLLLVPDVEAKKKFAGTIKDMVGAIYVARENGAQYEDIVINLRSTFPRGIDIYISGTLNKYVLYDSAVIRTARLFDGILNDEKMVKRDVKDVDKIVKYLKATMEEQIGPAQEKMAGVDNAEMFNKGGIDLAQSNLDMQIKRDGAGVPLPVSQQNLENIRINGLVPVILDIQPATSMSNLMH